MPTAARSLLVAPLLLLGCDSLLGGDEDPPKKTPKAAAEAKEDDGAAAADDAGEQAPPQPLVRATHRMRFGALGGERMGFALPKLSRVKALAGAIEVPEWSTPGEGSPRLTRDDDLGTAWVCEPTEENGCAIGIHFPKTTALEIIRMYSAAPKKGDFSRPKRLRVHTSDGWADVRFDDEDLPWNITLGEPYSTREVTIEILETHGDGPVHLAEIEFYGNGGTARRPLPLDMNRRVITHHAPLWRSKAKTHRAQPSFVEQIDVDGRRQRLFPGSAVVGKPGDRLVLVEHLDWTTCDDGQGTYELLDLETRVFVPVGDLGHFGAPIYRHEKGLGIAVGTLGIDTGSVQAMVIDGDKYEHRVSNRLDRRHPKELLEAWSIKPTPLPRADAHTLDDPPAGCGAARIEHLDALRPHLKKGTKLVAEQWHSCTLGAGMRALLTTGGNCGKQWQVAVVDEEGELLGNYSEREAGAHMRLRRLDGESMLVEIWGSKDSPTLLKVDIDGANAIEGRVSLGLRPPAKCRSTCDTSFADLRPESK